MTARDGFDDWSRANGEHVIDNDGVVVESAPRRFEARRDGARGWRVWDTLRDKPYGNPRSDRATVDAQAAKLNADTARIREGFAR